MEERESRNVTVIRSGCDRRASFFFNHFSNFKFFLERALKKRQEEICCHFPHWNRAHCLNSHLVCGSTQASLWRDETTTRRQYKKVANWGIEILKKALWLVSLQGLLLLNNEILNTRSARHQKTSDNCLPTRPQSLLTAGKQWERKTVREKTATRH